MIRNWKRFAEAGATTAVQASEEAVPASHLREAYAKIRELERALGRTTNLPARFPDSPVRWFQNLVPRLAALKLGRHDEARRVLDRALTFAASRQTLVPLRWPTSLRPGRCCTWPRASSSSTTP